MYSLKYFQMARIKLNRFIYIETDVKNKKVILTSAIIHLVRNPIKLWDLSPE